jgi:hypothetical protein
MNFDFSGSHGNPFAQKRWVKSIVYRERKNVKNRYEFAISGPKGYNIKG